MLMVAVPVLFIYGSKERPPLKHLKIFTFLTTQIPSIAGKSMSIKVTNFLPP